MSRSAPSSLASDARLGLGQPVARRRPAGEVHPHAGGGQPALEAGGEVVRDVGLGPPQRAVGHADARVAAAVARVDDDALVDQRRSGGLEPLGLAQQVRAAADHLAAEPVQGGHRLRAADAVGDEADLALEAGERGGGAAAEDAVRAAEVVAHLEQPLLQLPHVVTEQRLGLLVGEYARPERPP